MSQNRHMPKQTVETNMTRLVARCLKASFSSLSLFQSKLSSLSDKLCCLGHVDEHYEKCKKFYCLYNTMHISNYFCLYKFCRS